MKITDVRAQLLRPTEQLFQWKLEWPPRRVALVLARVIGEDGLEGNCITWLCGPGEFEDMLPKLKAVMVGRDVHDVEAISLELTDRLQQPSAVASAADIALWDLIGKHHGEPVYKLLGAARHRVRAYTSTITYDKVDEYVGLALQCRSEGFTAYKIHAFGVPDRDIEVCRAVKEAVGDSMDLMLDPVNAYDRLGAHKVAKVLEELDFYWFEAPIPDADLQGLKDLTRKYRIPITATESVSGGLLHYHALPRRPRRRLGPFGRRLDRWHQRDEEVGRAVRGVRRQVRAAQLRHDPGPGGALPRDARRFATATWSSCRSPRDPRPLHAGRDAGEPRRLRRRAH